MIIIEKHQRDINQGTRMADDKEEDTRIKNEEFELKFRLKFSR